MKMANPLGVIHYRLAIDRVASILPKHALGPFISYIIERYKEKYGISLPIKLIASINWGDVIASSHSRKLGDVIDDTGVVLSKRFVYEELSRPSNEIVKSGKAAFELDEDYLSGHFIYHNMCDSVMVAADYLHAQLRLYYEGTENEDKSILLQRDEYEPTLEKSGVYLAAVVRREVKKGKKKRTTTEVKSLFSHHGFKPIALLDAPFTNVYYREKDMHDLDTEPSKPHDISIMYVHQFVVVVDADNTGKGKRVRTEPSWGSISSVCIWKYVPTHPIFGRHAWLEIICVKSGNTGLTEAKDEVIFPYRGVGEKRIVEPIPSNNDPNAFRIELFASNKIRTGSGSAMIFLVVKKCLELGIKNIFLSVSTGKGLERDIPNTKGNNSKGQNQRIDSTLRFYENCGFVPVLSQAQFAFIRTSQSKTKDTRTYVGNSKTYDITVGIIPTRYIIYRLTVTMDVLNNLMKML